jgi:DNA polymerase alpha subunit A
LYGDTSSDGPLDDGLADPSSDDLFMSPKKKAKMTSDGDMTPATERLAQLEVHSDYDSAADMSFDDMDMDAFMEVDDEEINGMPQVKVEPVAGPIPSTSLAKKELDAPAAWLSLYDSLSVAEPDTLGPLASNSPSANSSQISALEPDGSLRFYWLDYLEHEGKLYFVGKLKDKVSNAWVSCCVTVEGVQRNLFVLPREKRVEQGEDGDTFETDVIPTPQDVHADFELIRKQIGVKSWKGKFVKRKYAFGETDVPRGESQWLKVVYGFNGMFNLSLDF